MNKYDAKALLEKYNLGTCTQEEKTLVEEWLLFAPFGEQDLSDAEILNDLEDIGQGLPLAGARQVKLPSKRLRRFMVAAAVILITGGSYFFYGQQNAGAPVANKVAKLEDVLPGGNKALLTLANGQTITLEDAGSGQLAVEAGVKIIKTADGQLQYLFEDASTQDQEEPATAIRYNTVSTPKGGQYQVTLPDGTKVWLNAASSLKFPASFAAMNRRRVELTGEAYFEVAKSKSVPFIVTSPTQAVEVLGTHFNVNAYADEPYVKTTLLEGSVRVRQGSQSQLIQPDQQALTRSNAAIIVSPVDAIDQVAWKNGLFSFKDADIHAVMRQISRWYNMEVSYDTNLPATTFTGKIYRNGNLGKVLESIAYMGLDFTINDHTIIVKTK